MPSVGLLTLLAEGERERSIYALSGSAVTSKVGEIRAAGLGPASGPTFLVTSDLVTRAPGATGKGSACRPRGVGGGASASCVEY